MSAERRRRRGLLGLIFDDPYRKLVAIGLAVMLWFFINSRIMDSEVFVMPLREVDQQQIGQSVGDSDELLVYIPSDRVRISRYLDGDREIKDVRVKLSGPRYKIDQLREERLRLKVKSLLDREWSRRSVNGTAGSVDGIEIVEFTAAEIERDVRREDVTIELVPPRVRLEIEIQDNIVLTMANNLVRFDAGGEEGRLRSDTATYSPSEVTLLGPAVGIRKLHTKMKDGEKLFRARMNIQGMDGAVTETLTIIDGEKLLVYPDGAAPQVTIQLDARREQYTVILPVVVDDLGMKTRGLYEPESKTVPVKVSFSGSLGHVAKLKSTKDLNSWAAENFRIVVYIREPKDGEAALGDTLSQRPFLQAVGDLKVRDHSEYELEEHRIIKVSKKK